MRSHTRKQPPPLPFPASQKLPSGTRRFCHSRFHVLLKDLLIGVPYNPSSFSHQTAVLLSVYICSGSISQGCLFLQESLEVSPAFPSENLPKIHRKETENRCSVDSSAASLAALIGVGPELEHHLNVPGWRKGGTDMAMETVLGNCGKSPCLV